MHNLAHLLRSRVISFDRESFDNACADLWRLVSADRRPDVLIGIQTGGAFVADSMAKAAGVGVPVLALTCRRPSSRYKPASSALKGVVAGLPRPVVDGLRLVEHALLTRRPRDVSRDQYRLSNEELEAVDAGIAAMGGEPRLLIVDDAVDSGATLSIVMDAIRRRAPPAATLRSAVITVTTGRPLISPDYALYHRQLCRFPWSLDAPSAAPC